MTEQAFKIAVSLIDAANTEDPNQELADDKNWPKELLYSNRMSQMLERYKPKTDLIIKLAVQAQHIERWKSPRSDYPMGRQGYHQWRTSLYKFHADRLAEILAQAGFEQTSQERAKKAVSKKELKINEDSQLVEDVASLVFIEHYMISFAKKYPEYNEEKWHTIISRTWKKMSVDAHEFVLAGKVKLPEALAPLILKSVSMVAD